MLKKMRSHTLICKFQHSMFSPNSALVCVVAVNDKLEQQIVQPELTTLTGFPRLGMATCHVSSWRHCSGYTLYAVSTILLCSIIIMESINMVYSVRAGRRYGGASHRYGSCGFESSSCYLFLSRAYFRLCVVLGFTVQQPP